MPRFTAARSELADPYPQAVVFERGDRHFAVASGGGGGAAQLLPADLLGRILDTAWRSAAAAWSDEDHLLAFIDAAHAGVVELRRDPVWLGTTAHLAAAWWDPARSCVWASGVGRAEVYAVQGGEPSVVHRETTLPGTDLVVAALGMCEPPARPRRIDVAPGDRIVLASHAQLAGEAFVAVLREVHEPSALWHVLRERAASTPQFDRRAVIGVVEPRSL
ncbi:MAG TPA: hypothetical protein VLX92_15720 [Kofleriaceae bacterium]|nr:hypothetical protein [Kofleriaceae bacterium]